VLMNAAWSGQTAALEALILHGASIDAQNSNGYGRNPHTHHRRLKLFYECGELRPQALDRNPGTNQLLWPADLASQAMKICSVGDPNFRYTALMRASLRGHSGAVKALLRAGAVSNDIVACNNPIGRKNNPRLGCRARLIITGRRCRKLSPK
jgi:ankyrin repeat protein